MCGRFRQKGRPVAPGAVAEVVGGDGPMRLRFGYLAPWQMRGDRPLINARSETLGSKPAWREAAEARRCAVAVEGWTERDHEHRGADGQAVWLAAIWWEQGFVLVTCASCPALQVAHHRQPALLAEPDGWVRAGPLEGARPALSAMPPGTSIEVVRSATPRRGRGAQRDLGW